MPRTPRGFATCSSVRRSLVWQVLGVVCVASSAVLASDWAQFQDGLARGRTAGVVARTHQLGREPPSVVGDSVYLSRTEVLHGNQELIV